MSVPHGCVDARMPHEHLDRSERYPAHDKVRGERVSERVPPDFAQAGFFADTCYSARHSVRIEGLVIGVSRLLFGEVNSSA